MILNQNYIFLMCFFFSFEFFQLSSNREIQVVSFRLFHRKFGLSQISYQKECLCQTTVLVINVVDNSSVVILSTDITKDTINFDLIGFCKISVFSINFSLYNCRDTQPIRVSQIVVVFKGCVNLFGFCQTTVLAKKCE